MKKDRKLLVVDDEVHILYVLSLKLRQGGYRVILCRNGGEAFEAAQVERPDLIITDYQMPCLSGLELCRKLRQMPATADIPALMLTAQGYHLEPRTLRAAGIEACLHKPFSPRAVLEMVDQMLMPVGV